MLTRSAVWLLLLALPASAQTPPAEVPDSQLPGASQDRDQPAEAAAPAPDRFLPSDRIPPDSVISFPADI